MVKTLEFPGTIGLLEHLQVVGSKAYLMGQESGVFVVPTETLDTFSKIPIEHSYFISSLYALGDKVYFVGTGSVRNLLTARLISWCSGQSLFAAIVRCSFTCKGSSLPSRTRAEKRVK